MSGRGVNTTLSGAIIRSQCAAILDPKEVSVQLPTAADNVTLLAFAAECRPCSN